MQGVQALAADIGGTSMRAAVIDRGGRILARRSIATRPERGIEDATERLAALLREVQRETAAGPVAIGVSTAGPVDPATGTYAHPPNLSGWHGASMQPRLEELLRLPVAVGHDATLAALAETRFGAARGARHLLYVTVSTGIGGGIVADGVPVTGSRGGAGEVGHLIVVPDGPACGAGCRGCLEAVASGPAIAGEARRRMLAGAASSLRQTGAAGPRAADVFRAARDGDTLARAVIDGAIAALGRGLAGLMAVLDPEIVILGGGVTAGLADHWAQLVEATRDAALPRYAPSVPLQLTTLGEDVSLLGAALLAFERAGRPLPLPARS